MIGEAASRIASPPPPQKRPRVSERKHSLDSHERLRLCLALEKALIVARRALWRTEARAMSGETEEVLSGGLTADSRRTAAAFALFPSPFLACEGS